MKGIVVSRSPTHFWMQTISCYCPGHNWYGTLLRKLRFSCFVNSAGTVDCGNSGVTKSRSGGSITSSSVSYAGFHRLDERYASYGSWRSRLLRHYKVLSTERLFQTIFKPACLRTYQTVRVSSGALLTFFPKSNADPCCWLWYGSAWSSSFFCSLTPPLRLSLKQCRKARVFTSACYGWANPPPFFFLKQCWLYLLSLQQYQLRTACSIANQVAFDLGASNFSKCRKLSPWAVNWTSDACVFVSHSLKVSKRSEGLMALCKVIFFTLWRFLKRLIWQTECSLCLWLLWHSADLLAWSCLNVEFSRQTTEKVGQIRADLI